MTIIVFLIDTSASMNQRAYLGGRPTLLDVAKGAVETFVKVRQRSPESRGDRYMLLTFEDPPNNIKAGWKENLATFMNELKNLQCTGLTTMGAALKHTFDVLNINRMQTGIDTYGQGRCPFFLEPSVIVVITDGSKLSNSSGVQDDFVLPMTSPIPGSELTREPFRWDQRLFSLVLRLAGTPAIERDIGLVPSDTSPIDAMCEVTGGRSYSITSHRMLMQCIDSLVQKVQSGVVINFEKIGPDPPPVDCKDEITEGENGDDKDDNPRTNNAMSTGWQSCRRLIYVPRSAQKGFAVGFWPIPESFWPDLTASALPPRTAHPNLKFTCTSQEPMVIENLPFDKYELEPSPLTQFILARKQPTVCWQVFVNNSYKNSDVGHPFGYLKASTNLSCVNLFVMPYNYPMLLQLLEDLFKTHRLKPTNEWRVQLTNYLKMMPSYYVGPLRRALTRMGAPASLAQTLLPDTLETSLSFSVTQYLKKLKLQAKNEYERLCDEVSNRQASKVQTEGIRAIPRSPLKKDLVSHPSLQDKFGSLKEQLSEFGGFVVGIPKLDEQKIISGSYRNPFDISRRNLIDQVIKMRRNFLQSSPANTKLVDEDFRHSMPLSQMGNYQEHLKRLPSPLREIETPPVRQHMFGNPFKIDKRMMVDEADVDVVGSLGRGSKRPVSDPGSPRPTNRRKPGPLPKDFQANSRSPSPGPPMMLSTMSPSPPPPPLTPPLPPPVDTVLVASNILKDNSNSTIINNNPSTVPAPAVNMLPKLPNMASLSNSASVINRILKEENNIDDYPTLQMADDELEEEVNDVAGGRSRSPSPPILTNENLAPYETAINMNDDFLPPIITLQNDLKLEPRLNRINAVVVGAGPGTLTTTTPDENKRRPDVKQFKIDHEEIRSHNIKIKKVAFKHVRRPGKNYTPMLECVKDVRGDLETKKLIIKDIVKECLRFKRKTLANLLENFVTSSNL